MYITFDEPLLDFLVPNPFSASRRISTVLGDKRLRRRFLRPRGAPKLRRDHSLDIATSKGVGAYLWAEATDLEKLAAEGGDWPSEAVLASLFRDLGVADVDAAPGPAAPASDTAPHPDAEIFSLAEKCATANQRFEAACEAFNEAEQRYVDIKPPQPLIKTEEDAKMRLFVLGCPGETYDRPEIAVIGAILRSLRNGGGPIQHIGAAEPSLKHGASGLPKKRQKVREPATTGPIALRGTRWACSRAPRRNWR
jgi:hypothetical protein